MKQGLTCSSMLIRGRLGLFVPSLLRFQKSGANTSPPCTEKAYDLRLEGFQFLGGGLSGLIGLHFYVSCFRESFGL